MSEDCLFLNVFVPATPPPSAGRPVMFWIHGGDLEFGYNSLPTYDGSVFAAEQDVIVVTINYRLNVFGFPNSDEIAIDKQNLGFLDQRLALDFVKDNIKAFGGVARLFPVVFSRL
jgi:carboxylesterase type B